MHLWWAASLGIGRGLLWQHPNLWMLYLLLPIFLFALLLYFPHKWKSTLTVYLFLGYFLSSLGFATALVKLFTVSSIIAAVFVGISMLALVSPTIFFVSLWEDISAYFRLHLPARLLGIPLAIYFSDLLDSVLLPTTHVVPLATSPWKLAQLFSIFGSEGVSFLLFLFCGGGVVAAHFLYKRQWLYGLVLVFTLTLVFAGSYGLADAETKRWRESDSKLTFSSFQPNTHYYFAQGPEVFLRQEEEFLQKLQKRVEEMQSQNSDSRLLILPEYQFLTQLEEPHTTRQIILSSLAQSQISLVTGLRKIENGQIFNTMVFFDQDGQFTYEYQKVYLMPFGETKPFSKTLSFARDYLPGYDDVERGPGLSHGVYKFQDITYGLGICYEDIFTHIFSQHSKRGAEILLSLANDNIFGFGDISTFHSMAAAARALEARRPLIRIVTSGGSLVRTAAGETLFSAKDGDDALFTQTVPFLKNPELSTFHKIIWWCPLFFTALSMLFIGLIHRLSHRDLAP